MLDDAESTKVRFSPIQNAIVAEIGFDTHMLFRDTDEAHSFIDQLQDAIRAQVDHQGRTLTRDENEIRSAATIREALQ